MIHFLLFIIILIYIYEVWKSIKIRLHKYNQKYLKDIKYIENFEDFNNIKKLTPIYVKYGYIPHNVADFSHNYLEPPIQNITDLKKTALRKEQTLLDYLKQKKKEQINGETNDISVEEEVIVEEEELNNKFMKYYPKTYRSLPHPNPDLDNPMNTKYYGNVNIPYNQHCQRDWMECNQSKYTNIKPITLRTIKDIDLQLK